MLYEVQINMEINEDTNNNNEVVEVEHQVLLERPNGGGFELKIEVEELFDLEKAVCNHGFFMTAPNNWISSSNTFQRPLRISSDNNSVLVSISQASSTNAGNYLLVLVHGVDSLSSIDQHLILEQVGRMLRISSKDEYDMRMFHEVDAKAKKSGFGRLFRSPDLFEDIIKSILLCNTSWRRTLEMCQALCNLGEEHSGNFPSSKEVANLDEEFLRHSCRLGYRAKTVIKVAQLIENGKLKLDEFEGHGVVEDTKSYKVLVKVKGIGSFTTANIFMCIGIYHKIPIDIETIEHMIKVHRKKHFKNRTTMDRIINKFH